MSQWADARQGIRKLCGHLNLTKSCDMCPITTHTILNEPNHPHRSETAASIRFKDPRPHSAGKEWAGLLSANLTHISK